MCRTGFDRDRDASRQILRQIHDARYDPSPLVSGVAATEARCRTPVARKSRRRVVEATLAIIDNHFPNERTVAVPGP